MTVDVGWDGKQADKMEGRATRHKHLSTMDRLVQ